MAGYRAVRNANPPAAFLSVNNYEQIALGTRRQFARPCQSEGTAIRFGETDSLFSDDEKPFHIRGIAVVVMNYHILSAERVRVTQYLSLQNVRVNLKSFLGEGTDGAVWSTERDTAVKVFSHERGYYNERDTYQRLADFGITEKLGQFWVAKMIGFDDDLKVIEMDLMQQPPYIIDFAKVRLDRSPEFSAETIEESENQGRENFGENWGAVKLLLSDLESYQIYYLDPKPHNIVFPASGYPIPS